MLTEQWVDCAEQEPAPERWGLESAHFMVWMRTSALPRVQKLYARLDGAAKPRNPLHFE